MILSFNVPSTILNKVSRDKPSRSMCCNWQSRLANSINTLREQQRELQDRLDNFKILLGLPTDFVMTIDDSLLNQFQFIDPSAHRVGTGNHGLHPDLGGNSTRMSRIAARYGWSRRCFTRSNRRPPTSASASCAKTSNGSSRSTRSEWRPWSRPRTARGWSTMFKRDRRLFDDAVFILEGIDETSSKISDQSNDLRIPSVR